MSALPNPNPSGHSADNRAVNEDAADLEAVPSGPVGLGPLEALGAAMEGISVEQYREQSKRVRQFYRDSIKLACKIRDGK